MNVGLTVSWGHTLRPDTLVVTMFVCVASLGAPVTGPTPLAPD